MLARSVAQRFLAVHSVSAIAFAMQEDGKASCWGLDGGLWGLVRWFEGFGLMLPGLLRQRASEECSEDRLPGL
jgi:hypothetical protein